MSDLYGDADSQDPDSENDRMAKESDYWCRDRVERQMNGE